MHFLVPTIMFWNAVCRVSLLSLLVLLVTIGAFGQEGPYANKTDAKANRARGLQILEQIRWVLKTQYYDAKLKGIDLESRIKHAEEQIKGLDQNWQIYRAISQVLSELGDSHTAFWPPDRLFSVEYGFAAMMVGEKCLVIDVKKGSDAEKKGLSIGDEIILYGVVKPTRSNFSTINYIIYGLDWQEKLNLQLVTREGKSREIVIETKFISPKERRQERDKRKNDESKLPYFCKELNADNIACKLKTFDTITDSIDGMFKSIGSKKNLILDLRGNSGGSVKVMERLLSYLFDKNTPLGSEIQRSNSKEYIIKGRSDAFTGGLAILIDGDSASASELVAKAVLLEKRGTVYGDVTAGAVMTSIYFGLEIPKSVASVSNQMSMPYWVALMQVSIGEFVSRDGDRIEGVGVAPHVTLLPTPNDLFSKHDPVFSYAAGRLGVKLSPQEAGALEFLMKKPEEKLDAGNADPEKSK